MDFEKETLLEGGLMGLEFEASIKAKEATSPQPDATPGEMNGRPSSSLLSNKVAPEVTIYSVQRFTMDDSCEYVKTVTNNAPVCVYNFRT